MSQLDWTRTVVPYGLRKAFASVGGVSDDVFQDGENTKVYNVLFNLGAEPADDDRNARTAGEVGGGTSQLVVTTSGLK